MPDQPHACTWPDCLTPDQHTELAAQVTAEEHGEHRPAMPDQRAVCGCSEAACHCGLGTRAQCVTKAWGCGPGSTDPNTAPAPAPVDPALQQRTAQTLHTADGHSCSENEGADYQALAAAVLAELAPELTRAQFGDRTRQELADLAVNAANALRDEKRHYRIACQEIARLTQLLSQYADRGIANGERAELAEAAHEEHRRTLAVLLGLPPDTTWTGLTRRITVQQQALAEPQAVCPCGLGTRLGCATEPWGCVHDHEQPRDDEPAPAAEGSQP